MTDNITLPREVVERARKALKPLDHYMTVYDRDEIADTLRTHLAAEQPKPEPVRCNPADYCAARHMNLYAAPPAAPKQEHPGYIIGSHWLETAYSRICAGEAEEEVLRDCGWRRCAVGQGLTQYCAEAEALRRDAERYRWLRDRAWFQFEFEGRYGDSGETVQELDAAIDAAMGEKR